MLKFVSLLLSLTCCIANAQMQLTGYALDVPYPNAVLIVTNATMVPANSGGGSYTTPSCHVSYRIYENLADLTYDQQQRAAAAAAGNSYTGIELTDGSVDIVDSGHLNAGAVVWDSTPYSTYLAAVDPSNWSALSTAIYAAMKIQGNTQVLMNGAIPVQG